MAIKCHKKVLHFFHEAHLFTVCDVYAILGNVLSLSHYRALTRHEYFNQICSLPVLQNALNEGSQVRVWTPVPYIPNNPPLMGTLISFCIASRLACLINKGATGLRYRSPQSVKMVEVFFGPRGLRGVILVCRRAIFSTGICIHARANASNSGPSVSSSGTAGTV